MPNYSKVQFIAWEIYTGPVYQNHLADHYPGIAPALGDRRWDVLSQCLDISARVQFTKKALDAAYESADQDENTLKVPRWALLSRTAGAKFTCGPPVPLQVGTCPWYSAAALKQSSGTPAILWKSI